MSNQVTPVPPPPDMKDRNGFSLKVGDLITYNGGEGRIQEYLGAGSPRGGAVVRIKHHKQTVDIALLFAQAEYKRDDGLVMDHKYGV